MIVDNFVTFDIPFVILTRETKTLELMNAQKDLANILIFGITKEENLELTVLQDKYFSESGMEIISDEEQNYSLMNRFVQLQTKKRYVKMMKQN